ncbi:uncharacterized protein isoform X1 [Danio rerio]|uniref:Si:dkey-65l23.2 n=14 Tax=Danio rerio TaxID=7955 RepID=F6P8X7_DANRE|nr:uncharacterized protein LOC793688 [Danio rerio]|eukprot:NP_001093522.1 uncharacterized protein LOC793688 [Danio rerio]
MMDNQCYALVEFPDKGTDVVPENWLLGQKCYWPNYNPTKIKTAVKKKEAVKDGWKLFEPVRLLKKCDTLEKAQKMLKMYVESNLPTSELTSDEEGSGNKIKRKKRPNPRFIDFSENDSDQDITSHKLRLAAAPPIDFTAMNASANLASGQTDSGCHVNPKRGHIEHHGTSHVQHQECWDPAYLAHQNTQYNETHQVTAYRAHEDTHEGHQDRHHQAHQDRHHQSHQDTYRAQLDTRYSPHLDPQYRAHQSTYYRDHQGTLSELVNERYMDQTSSQTASALVPSELSPFKRNVLKILLEIKNEQREQRAMIQQLQGAPIPIPLQAESSFAFPAQSLDDFDALEKMLQNDAETNRLICQLSLLGGLNLQDTVRRMLSHVLTNRLASHFNWAGRGKKRSFEASNLQKTMFRALRNTSQGKEASKTDFSEVVKKWLRYAPDRDGGSGRQ